jgi:putative CocE/NonD family hydrolase
MYRLRNPHVVGDRDMGKVHFDLDDIVYSFFDYYMKGKRNRFSQTQAPVQYFAMGDNEWQTSQQWPPRGATKMTLYLRSNNNANSTFGEGALTTDPPAENGLDSFSYDPMNPVPSLGGNICCLGNAVPPGSFDQRPIEVRDDVLVYTSDPLQSDLEVTGPIDVLLFVSSDARDTDFTIKLLDVESDGTSWNLDETIQRVRYREGYDQELFMEVGEIYELRLGPLVTSNVFRAGHRIRIEISSSNFPRFERNLNTGGINVRETSHIVANNAVHHGPGRASHIVLTTITR